MMIARIPSATAINVHGVPETRGRSGSCNIARAIRDGVGGVPAASSSAAKGGAAASSADTLLPAGPRSSSWRNCPEVGTDLSPDCFLVIYKRGMGIIGSGSRLVGSGAPHHQFWLLNDCGFHRPRRTVVNRAPWAQVAEFPLWHKADIVITLSDVSFWG
jgi:hypothetical protein